MPYSSKLGYIVTKMFDHNSSSIDKITFLISQFLLSGRMYKVLFYHKWDFFICGILGLYHIWLIQPTPIVNKEPF
ncbi:hypothetical protein JMUB3870_2234 [Leptotrichia trevisanii]|uniref:Uncharacterized protein n=1 Tax=Leptotrichia trevisanii TaxID=109328 RepID=A0A510K4H6_9FUSO|nr:hypothetical protein JMUB3870_2234 [Leptotrichia trevisanii]